MRTFRPIFLLSLALFSSCGSNQNSSSSGSSISISPGNATVVGGSTTQFVATVPGIGDQRVTWSVLSPADRGTIDASGNYTAPLAESKFQIKATSVVDPKKSGIATVTVSGAQVPEQLNAIWGSATNDVLVVGSGCTYRWDGTQWTRRDFPSRYPETVNQLYAVWGASSTDIWSVGSSIGLDWEHFNGSSWTYYPPPLTILVVGMWGSGSNDIWAVGVTDPGMYFHWNGAAWSYAYFNVTSGENAGMAALWGSAANDVWAVGSGDDTGTKREAASVFHWNGSDWTQVISGLDFALNGVSGTSSGDVWVVGINGKTAHWDGSAWTPVSSPVTHDLWGVYAIYGVCTRSRRTMCGRWATVVR
jgi:hypothetical protein